MAKRSYTKQDKLRAAVSFQLYGTIKAAADQAKIPRKTVSDWIHGDEEFAEQYQVAIEQGKSTLDARLSSLIDKSLKGLNDKLDDIENITARELATISAILYDKRALSRNQPTSIRAVDSTNQLAQLASVFDKLVTSKNNTEHSNIIDMGAIEPVAPPYKEIDLN